MLDDCSAGFASLLVTQDKTWCSGDTPDSCPERFLHVLDAAGEGYDSFIIGTSLATGTTSSYTVGGAFSHKAGVVVGFNFAMSVSFIANVEALRIEGEITAEIEREGHYDHTREVSETFTNTCGAGEDLVICLAVPYDVFTCTVVPHPDPACVGTKVVISTPRIRTATR